MLLESKNGSDFWSGFYYLGRVTFGRIITRWVKIQNPLTINGLPKILKQISSLKILLCNQMGEHSFFNNMMMNLRSTCKYYTGYPKDLGPSKVIHFTSEREFVHLLHQGHPVIVAFTIKSNYTKHLDKVLEEAAAEFYPQIKFMRVECPKYIGFCMTRQKKDYPFIEMFHSPAQANNQARAIDPNVTKYSVKVLPYNYDVSAYGFREFFKRHNIQSFSHK